MQNRSRSVQSNQSGSHPDLAATVSRHLSSDYQRPVAAHSEQAFEQIAGQVAQENRPLVLDGGCGTGESTRWLADQHPDAWVIGIDRSASRLGDLHRSPQTQIIWARSNLEDFWRLAAAAGWRFQAQYLFYPNPYPKKQQLNKRWHGHPVLPAIVKCGGTIEVRTNWGIYAWEFGKAMDMVDAQDIRVSSFKADEPVSRFERKYAESGHKLFRVTALFP